MPKKTKEPTKPKEEKTSFYQAVGRRKESTARVRLVLTEELVLHSKSYKKGDVVINSRSADHYFPGKIFKEMYLLPFKLTGTQDRFITTAVISGGGLSGQLGALTQGIARSLEKIDKEKYRPLLKKQGLLTRDPRTKERRKAGFAQKARA